MKYVANKASALTAIVRLHAFAPGRWVPAVVREHAGFLGVQTHKPPQPKAKCSKLTAGRAMPRGVTKVAIRNNYAM
jgi:hypothetical protein